MLIIVSFFGPTSSCSAISDTSDQNKSTSFSEYEKSIDSLQAAVETKEKDIEEHKLRLRDIDKKAFMAVSCQFMALYDRYSHF